MLILVRHGQTQANADARVLGRADPPLTELGRRQATAMAAAVGSVDRVVASPLLRAAETAACFGVPVEVDERWIELDFGEYDERLLTDVPAEVWQRWRGDTDYAPPGGESLVSVGARVRAACEALAEDARERNVVVVSHVSPIKAAVTWALGTGDDVIWRLFLDLASVSKVQIGPHGPILRTYNDTTHLSST
ncbi:MAG: histidine phosphatase family protein [Actinobacteria bacterium]|nr:histidine phosphatase family protein [Actinomycetota bacterium]